MFLFCCVVVCCLLFCLFVVFCFFLVFLFFVCFCLCFVLCFVVVCVVVCFVFVFVCFGCLFLFVVCLWLDVSIDIGDIVFLNRFVAIDVNWKHIEYLARFLRGDQRAFMRPPSGSNFIVEVNV